MRLMPPGDMRAMLITAGFGTRLAPLTDLLPKPALPVGNRPVAWFTLDHLRRAGIHDFVLNTHHLARELELALGAVAPQDVQIRYVHEQEILGTGGGIRNAWQPRPGETFLVANGKLVFAPDIAAARSLHLESEAFATMIVREVPASDPTGVLRVDSAGQLRELPGFAAAESGDLRRCMYTGISLLSERVHAQLPERGCLVRDGYARWLARGERVMTYIEAADFRDVGMSHAHYHEANIALATGRVRWPGFEISPPQVLRDEGVQLGAGATLEACVVGRGAQIASGVRLERCVVWPNTQVVSSHTEAILAPNGLTLQVPLL